MLFYTTLFITSLILTLIILSLYKLTVAIVRKVFQGNLPHERSAAIGHADQRSLDRSSKTESDVWGGYGHSNPSTVACTYPALPDKATPWGWGGQDRVKDEYRPRPAASKTGDLNSYLSRHVVNRHVVGTGRVNVDGLCRDDHPAFVGRTYKEARKAASIDLRHKVEGKPWGW